VSDRKTFLDKVNGLIFGETSPPRPSNELAAIARLNRKLETLLARLDAPPAQPQGHVLEQPAFPLAAPIDGAAEDLAEQVRKLAKAQFKANTLQEAQLAQQKETLAGLQKTIEQQGQQLAELRQQQQRVAEQAQMDLLTHLLPVLDSLDAAFISGRRQVLKLAMPAETQRAVIGWLDGIRLARVRLLDLLQSYHVSPIQTVGERFDPNRHVAVATDTTGRAPEGIIVGEDRRGYTTPDKVLRYAEVVVAKSN
jgi:molecular chaperone GrpE